jgi:hypothetical protein
MLICAEYTYPISQEDAEVNHSKSHSLYSIETEEGWNIYKASNCKYILFDELMKERMPLVNFLLFAQSRIPNFFELAMLDVSKISDMFLDVKLSKELVAECGGNIPKAYRYDRFGRFLAENFKINELIAAMDSDEDLRLLNKINDNNYVLNEKFWNNGLCFANSVSNEKFNVNFYKQFRYRRFDKKSAKIFKFLMTDSIIMHIMLFGQGFFFDNIDNCLLGRMACSVKINDDGDYVRSDSSAKSGFDVFGFRGDNALFYLFDFNYDGCIKYLYESCDENSNIDYYEYAKVKCNCSTKDLGSTLALRNCYLPTDVQLVTGYLFQRNYPYNDNYLVNKLSKKVIYLEIWNHICWYYWVYLIVIVLSGCVVVYIYEDDIRVYIFGNNPVDIDIKDDNIDTDQNNKLEDNTAIEVK